MHEKNQESKKMQGKHWNDYGLKNSNFWMSRTKTRENPMN